MLGAHRDDNNDRDDHDEPAALKGAKFDAREAAQAGAVKGTVTEVGVDDDNGTVTWSVDTVKGGTAGEWKVDLQTGKVTQDRDAADNVDAGDDDCPSPTTPSWMTDAPR